MARVLTVLAAFALLVSFGCGSAAATPTEMTAATLHELGIGCTSDATKFRIRLHNSGAPCVEAAAVLVVLPGDASKPHPVYSNGKVLWICRTYGREQAPLVARCHKGPRYFTVERVSR